MNKAVIASYGFLGLPLAVVGLPLAIYLPPLYAQERGMPAATVSFVLLLARLADVFVDPAIGALSDRFDTPFGRRRPWIVLGAALTAAGVVHVFDPPAVTGWAYLLGWIAVLYLGWSMVTIPYLAWGGGLSSNYTLRSVITGTRETFGLLGIAVASVMPAALPGPLSRPMHAMAWLIAVLLPAATLVLIAAVPEPRLPPVRRTSGAWRMLWRNRPFRLLLGASLLGGIGTAVNATLVIFYLQTMNLGDHKELLLAYLLSAIAGVPLWVWLAARTGKHRALCYATFWGCGWFAIVPFIPAGAYWPVLLVNLMAGCTIGASPVLGASMAADVIDWDAIRANQDRSALFFALWSMSVNFTSSLGILALPLVVMLGFHTQGPNTAAGRHALTLFYCVVPILFWLAAVSLLWNFPIDRRRQAWIEARRSR